MSVNIPSKPIYIVMVDDEIVEAYDDMSEAKMAGLRLLVEEYSNKGEVYMPVRDILYLLDNCEVNGTVFIVTTDLYEKI